MHIGYVDDGRALEVVMDGQAYLVLPMPGTDPIDTINPITEHVLRRDGDVPTDWPCVMVLSDG